MGKNNFKKTVLNILNNRALYWQEFGNRMRITMHDGIHPKSVPKTIYYISLGVCLWKNCISVFTHVEVDTDSNAHRHDDGPFLEHWRRHSDPSSRWIRICSCAEQSNMSLSFAISILNEALHCFTCSYMSHPQLLERLIWMTRNDTGKFNRTRVIDISETNTNVHAFICY